MIKKEGAFQFHFLFWLVLSDPEHLSQDISTANLAIFLLMVYGVHGVCRGLLSSSIPSGYWYANTVKYSSIFSNILLHDCLNILNLQSHKDIHMIHMYRTFDYLCTINLQPKKYNEVHRQPTN